MCWLAFYCIRVARIWGYLGRLPFIGAPRVFDSVCRIGQWNARPGDTWKFVSFHRDCNNFSFLDSYKKLKTKNINYSK